jgi:hypothetical protein
VSFWPAFQGLGPVVARGFVARAGAASALPTASLGAVADVLEGNSGSAAVAITVTLSAPAGAGGAQISWAASGAGAAPADAADFQGGALPSGVVNIPAGQTSATINFGIAGDTAIEPDEGIGVSLFAAVGAQIGIGTRQFLILNDDAPVANLAAIANVTEGNTGTATVAVSVSLTGPAPAGGASVAWAVTGNGASPANAADFGGSFPSGTIVIPAGQTTGSASFTVAGDSDAEPDEGFAVTLSSPVNCTLGTATRTALILNDDASISEPAISAISADGVVATMAAAPSAARPDVPIVVRRSGYRMAPEDAAPVLTSWDETVWLATRRVTPGGPESAGYAGNDVMLSRAILPGDIFPNQAGITNNSTRAAPACDFRWLGPGGTTLGGAEGSSLVGNTITLRGSCNSFYTRGGLPVAAVAFVVSDGTQTLRFYARQPVPWSGVGLTGFSAHCWEVVNADISALANGRLTVNWELYGHHGQLVSSAGDSRNSTRWFHGTRYFRKHSAAAAAPLFAYVRPGSAAASPQVSTNAATARANPYGTWDAARAAAAAANNAAYGIAGLDGIIFRFMDTGAGGNVIPSSALPSTGTTTCLIAGYIIEPDPDGAWVGGSILEGGALPTSGITNPGLHVDIIVRRWSRLRRVAQATWWPGTASNFMRVWMLGPPGGGVIDFNGTGMSVFTSNSNAILVGQSIINANGTVSYLNENDGANHGIAGLLDCTIDATHNRDLTGHCLICVRAVNIRAISNLVTGRSQFMDAAFIEQSPTLTTAIMSSSNNQGLSSMRRNVVLVVLNSSEQNRSGLSGDANTWSLFNDFFHHCTVPGLAGNVRFNWGYLDGAAGAPASRVHRYAGFVGCVLPPIACKGEWFGNANTPDPAREPGWREVGYAVGSDGNLYTMHYATAPLGNENEAQRFVGRASQGGISAGPLRSSGPYVNPGFINPLVPTTVGGANGTAGGDYRHGTNLARAFEAAVRFDILGQPVPTNCARPGAYSGSA